MKIILLALIWGFAYVEAMSEVDKTEDFINQNMSFYQMVAAAQKDSNPLLQMNSQDSPDSTDLHFSLVSEDICFPQDNNDPQLDTQQK